ncbi:protein BIG GRAIN 1-like, partial [Triticum aestivum]|uniref:protein BIG GRAIN 1-like n=1 Tax=Triticum aestivum TaxID=4565 RepID=UPI001D00E9E2
PDELPCVRASTRGFSSSEAESSNQRRLRPICTIVPTPEKKTKKPAGASIRALRDLRKPASPDARWERAGTAGRASAASGVAARRPRATAVGFSSSWQWIAVEAAEAAWAAQGTPEATRFRGAAAATCGSDQRASE